MEFSITTVRRNTQVPKLFVTDYQLPCRVAPQLENFAVITFEMFRSCILLVALLQSFWLIIGLCWKGGGVNIYMSPRKLRTLSYISFKLCTYNTFVVRRTCILLGVYSTGYIIFGLWLIKRGVRDFVKTWHWFLRFLSSVWWSQ